MGVLAHGGLKPPGALKRVLPRTDNRSAHRMASIESQAQRSSHFERQANQVTRQQTGLNVDAVL